MLRKTVFEVAQKELAPKAAEIDKQNNFAERREFSKNVVSWDCLASQPVLTMEAVMGVIWTT